MIGRFVGHFNLIGRFVGALLYDWLRRIWGGFVGWRYFAVIGRGIKWMERLFCSDWSLREGGVSVVAGALL